MPLTGAAKAAYNRRYWQERKRRQKVGELRPSPSRRTPEPDTAPPPGRPEDPAGAFVSWAEAALRVPSGLMSGQPFEVHDWQRRFLAAALEPGIREAGLSVARKNGKSGLIAALLLAHLCGPLAARNWRGLVVSVTGLLAKELRTAMEEIAAASGLADQVRFLSTPTPGRAEGRWGSRVDFLAADKSSGHGVGADLAIIDEAGLLGEGKGPPSVERGVLVSRRPRWLSRGHQHPRGRPDVLGAGRPLRRAGGALD